jgi:hypothetical protein
MESKIWVEHSAEGYWFLRVCTSNLPSTVVRQPITTARAEFFVTLGVPKFEEKPHAPG